MSDAGADTAERIPGKASALWEFVGVWKHLGKDASRPPALQDITLTIPAGSWIAFTGPSGSGKTTLLSLLGVLERPSRGRICFDGQDLTRLSDHALARIRRRMGFIFQEYALIPRLPLWENVTYPLVPRGISVKQRALRAETILAQVGLSGYEGKRPEELSGGERQRTAIARALVATPEVILADEPTSNLDGESADAVRTILADLHRAGTTIVTATHDPLLSSLANQKYALRNGVLTTLPSLA